MNPAVRQPGPGRPPLPQRQQIDGDNAVTAVHPPLPDDFADFPPKPQQQPGPLMQPTMQSPPVPPPPVMQAPTVLHPPLPQRPGALPPEATTEEFPQVPGEPQAPLRAAPPTGRGTQVGPPSGRRQPVPQQSVESTQAHPAPFDDYDDDFPPGGPVSGPERGDAYVGREEYDDDLDGPPISRVDSFDEPDDEPTSAREWILMAAQVGVGAIAGAAVWLAFSWLWGMLPVVAVIAALLVIVGLVLGVRRLRRADDLQTTVLAILAGLVVTVSPAALLLLRR
jgi:hypothetical protein